MQIYQNALVERDLLLQSDGSLYVGKLVDQHMQGYGLVVYPDKSYYFGYFEKSQPRGAAKYKLKNSCFQLLWNDQGELASALSTNNDEFLQAAVDFNNGQYGNQIILKMNLSYGVQSQKKFDGFSIVHQKNGDSYYGNFTKGKFNGDGIYHTAELNTWELRRYIGGKVSSVQKQGTNLVPRSLIVKIFSRIYRAKKWHNAPSLAELQKKIFTCILKEEYPSTTISDGQKLHMDESRIPLDQESLQVYRIQDELNSSYEGKLTATESQTALGRLTEISQQLRKQSLKTASQQPQRQSKTETSQLMDRGATPQKQQKESQRSVAPANVYHPHNSMYQLQFTPIRMRVRLGTPLRLDYSPIKVIRSSSNPRITTIRPLMTIIRI